MLSMQKECPICKSHGKINNLRLCKINYTECVYICTNELCSYPGNCPWEYVTYNLFDELEDEGNTSEEVERDILNYAEKRKQIKYKEVKSSENEIQNLVISEGIPNLVRDQNKSIDIRSFQFNDNTAQVSFENICVPDLNTNKVPAEESRSELLKCDAESDNNKEKFGITYNKNKQNKFKIDVKSVVIYNSKDEFQTNFNTLKSAEINIKNVKNDSIQNDKPTVLAGSMITSPNDKINSKSVSLKFVKIDNTDTSNFVPCATNKKITLKLFNQPKKCETAPQKINELLNRMDSDFSSGKQKLEIVKYADKKDSHKLITNKLEPIKSEIISKEINKSIDKNDLDFLHFSPIKQSLILSPVKQEDASIKWESNINIGLVDRNKIEEIKPFEPKKLIRNKDRLPKMPLKIIDEIDLGSDTESLTLSPIMKKKTVRQKPSIQLKSTKKAADILNHYLEMADDKKEGVPIKETSVPEINIDLKKFVGIANASKYSGFIFKSKKSPLKKSRKQMINEDITKYNINCPSNNIKEANVIVEEIASSEQMTPLKTPENEKGADQELDDLLGEFLQNVDMADINQANLSTNCSDLTEWLDLL